MKEPKNIRRVRCAGCGEFDCQNPGGWNHRVVATYNKKWKVWEFSVREVYYKNHVISGWSGEPTYLCTDNSPSDMYEEVQAIDRAFQKPLLIEKDDKLESYGSIAVAVKPETPNDPK